MTPAVSQFAERGEGRGWQQASTPEVSLCQAMCAVVTASDLSEKELWGQRRVHRQPEPGRAGLSTWRLCEAHTSLQMFWNSCKPEARKWASFHVWGNRLK